MVMVMSNSITRYHYSTSFLNSWHMSPATRLPEVNSPNTSRSGDTMTRSPYRQQLDTLTQQYLLSRSCVDVFPLILVSNVHGYQNHVCMFRYSHSYLHRRFNKIDKKINMTIVTTLKYFINSEGYNIYLFSLTNLMIN